MLLQTFLHGATRLGKKDWELEKCMGPEEASLLFASTHCWG